MKRIVRLTERDLTRIVKRILIEQEGEKVIKDYDNAFEYTKSGGAYFFKGKEGTKYAKKYPDWTSAPEGSEAEEAIKTKVFNDQRPKLEKPNSTPWRPETPQLVGGDPANILWNLENPYGIKKTSASANVKTGITEPENIMPNWVSKSTLKRYATNILDEWKHNDAYFVSILIADIFNPYGSFMKNFKPGSVADTPGDFNFGAKTASIGMNMTQTVKLAKEFSNHFKNWWHTVIEPYRGENWHLDEVNRVNWLELDAVYKEILHKIGDDPWRSSGENTFDRYAQQIIDLVPWAKIPPISTVFDRMRKVKWSIVNSDGKTRTHFIINAAF